MEYNILNIVVSVFASLLFTSSSATTQPSIDTLKWQAIVPKTYTVQRGDSLATIAQTVYGDSEYWTLLWSDNKWLENPSTLYSDMQLRIRDTAVAEAKGVLPNELQQRLTGGAETHGTTIAAASVDIKKPVQTPIVQPSVAPTVTPSVQPTVEPTVEPTVAVDTRTTYDDLYKMAGEKYNVPWQILYGLHITETGGRGSGMIMNKSGSGATGPMQFMPGTWRAYGVDCSGDGVADIANVDDAVCGAANYIAAQDNLDHGLRRYGGAYHKTLSLARERGFDGPLQ